MRIKPFLFFLAIVFLLSCNERIGDKSFHGKIHVDDFQIDFKDCAVDDMGNAYFTGYVEPDYFKERVRPPRWLEGCEESSMVLYKLGPKGESLSLERFTEVSVGNAIIVTENNDVVVAGYYYSHEGLFTEDGRFLSVTLTRFDSEGRQLWSEVVFGGYESEGLEVIELNKELYVLTGKPNEDNFNAMIVKVSAQGKVLSQTEIEHEREVYPYQMVVKSGKIFIAAHIGGHGVVIQVNPETGEIKKSFAWNKMMSFPSLSVHPAGIVMLARGNDYYPIILLDEELNEIRRNSLQIKNYYGGDIRLCSDPKGATYILNTARSNKMELIKFNDHLAQLWRKRIENTPSFRVGGITVTNEGNILTSGRVGALYMNGDGYYSMFTPDGEVY